MASRVVLFGASGFTGQLTAHAMVGAGLRPLLVARSAIDDLAVELGGLETASADAGDPASIAALLSPGDVLVSTVGPFTRLGRAAVQAAVSSGAHYLDSGGEQPFIRSVFEEWGPLAVEADCALLPAMGYDYAPGNIAGALALQESGGRATEVRIGYFVRGLSGSLGMSSGTRASVGGVLLERQFAWRHGRMVTESGGRRVVAFRAGGRRRRSVSVGGSEHYSLPRLHPELQYVDVGFGWFGDLSRAAQLLSYPVAVIASVGPFRRVFAGVVTRLSRGPRGAGPDARQRAKQRALIVAEAFDATGRRVGRAELEGSNPYELTAGLLARSAAHIVAGRLTGRGALGPVEAFGLERMLADLSELGLNRV